MLFIEKRNEKTEKKQKKKSLPFLPLLVRLLLKVEICFACKCNCQQTRLSLPQTAYTSTFIQHCMGISLSVRPVDHQRRQLAMRFYSRCYYVRSGVGVSANRTGSVMIMILYPADQNFRTKKLLYLIFSKCSEETFRCSGDKFRGQFNLRRRVKAACSQIHNWTNGM